MRKQKALLEEEESIAKAARAPKKADLEADLELSNQQKEVAAFAFAAEASALEQTSENPLKLEFLPQEDPMERVENFVKKKQQLNQTLEKNQTSKNKQDDRPEKPEIVRKEFPECVERNEMANDLTRFLLRKDLTLSRLSTFTDKPEAFCTWKAFL